MGENVDKLLKLGEAINETVAIGELIFKDGKISMDDIVHTPAMYKAVANLVKAGKEYKEMLAEIKDIDAVEAITILNEIILKK